MPSLIVKKCGECNGTGVVTVRYEWHGVIGDGETKCPECGGPGKVLPPVDDGATAEGIPIGREEGHGTS